MAQVTDTHAHVTPERYKKAIAKSGTWYGLGPEAGELHRHGFTLPLEDRLAEMNATGAILFIHQGSDTCVKSRITRYSLPNGVGNPTERILSFSALVFGGVMDQCPNLKVLLAHGGGYTAFGIGRLDKIAGALESGEPGGPLTPPFPQPEGEYHLTRPPSSYLDEFFYDCVTYNGAALRFLIDSVGIERVMLGTDYPAPMFLQKSVQWVNDLPQLTSDEKEAILRLNSTKFLAPLMRQRT